MEETFINELKNLILLKIGIRTITPSDCKRISIEISRDLNKNVSETTIKRLFGFAVVKHKFSKFTLTTLLEYVDKEDLTRSLPKHVLLHQQLNTFDDWTTTENNARRITELTIKGIKHRSGLPYHMTIGRKFAEKDFDDFYKSNCSFTCFISPPGYGRTILLSHLAEKYFLNSHPAYQSSTLLFVNAANLFNNEYKTFNLEEQLKFQLAVNPLEGLINYIDNHYKKKAGKFILFMDGFIDLIMRRNLKFQIFESIINFISALEDITTIKLVMSMRSTTWAQFYERIRHSAHLRSKLFSGNYLSLNDSSNVPPLTEKEVDQVIFKINNSVVDPIDTRLKTHLKYPYHFQLYYQLKDEDPTFNHSSITSFYELITKFIQEKIYRSNYYTEKILFLKKFIQLTNYAKEGSSVAKDDLINELATFKSAYIELISGGILMEEKYVQNAHPKEYVRFIESHIFEYFLFIELLERYHLKLDYNFFKQITIDYYGTNLIYSLMQWSIRFIIRIGDIETLNLIFDLELSHQEKNQIILFTAEDLKYRFSYSMEIPIRLQKHKFHHNAIKHLLHFDLLDPSYKKSVELLLEIADTDENKLCYHAMLSTVEILSLDLDKINLRLNQLEGLRGSGSSWFINPYDFIWLIHQKLNGIKITQHPIFQKIELFKQNYTTLNAEGREIGSREVITYLYMCVINMFYGNSAELVKIIHSILRVRPKLFYKKSHFSTFIMNLLAIECARTCPGQKTDQMENIIGKRLENKGRGSFTQNSSAMYKLLKAEQNKNKGEYQQALNYAIDCLNLYKEAGLNSICLTLYNLIIKICMISQDFEKANQYKYEKYIFTEDRNLPKHLFPYTVYAHHGSQF